MNFNVNIFRFGVVLAGELEDKNKDLIKFCIFSSRFIKKYYLIYSKFIWFIATSQGLLIILLFIIKWFYWKFI